MVDLKVGLKALAALSILSLTACSSDVVIREPAPEPEVVTTQEKVSIDTLWTHSYSADEDLPTGAFRPAIVGQKVYVASNEGDVARIDAESGDEDWDLDLDTTLSAGIAANEKGSVVVARSGDVVFISADGAELWRTDINREVIQTPLLDDSTVYLQTTNSNVIALDITSGAEKWVYSSRSPSLTLRGTGQPVIYRNRLLVSLDSGNLIALEKSSGQLLWERRLQVPKGSNEFERIVDLDGRMTLSDNVLFVPGYQGNLSAVEAYTGQVLWQKEISSFMQPAYSVGRLYVADSSSHLIMLDYRSGEVKWESKDFEYRELTSPEALGLYVLSTDMEGNVYVIDKSSADVVAKKGLGDAPITLVSNAEYAVAQTANGKVRAFKLEVEKKD